MSDEEQEDDTVNILCGIAATSITFSRDVQRRPWAEIAEENAGEDADEGWVENIRRLGEVMMPVAQSTAHRLGSVQQVKKPRKAASTTTVSKAVQQRREEHAAGGSGGREEMDVDREDADVDGADEHDADEEGENGAADADFEGGGEGDVDEEQSEYRVEAEEEEGRPKRGSGGTTSAAKDAVKSKKVTAKKKENVAAKKKAKVDEEEEMNAMLDKITAGDLVARVMSDLLKEKCKKWKPAELGQACAAASIAAITKATKIAEARLEHDKETLAYAQDERSGEVLAQVLRIVEEQTGVARMKEERLSTDKYYQLEMAKCDPGFLSNFSFMKDITASQEEMEVKRLKVMEKALDMKSALLARACALQDRRLKIVDACDADGEISEQNKWLMDSLQAMTETMNIALSKLDLCDRAAFLKGGDVPVHGNKSDGADEMPDEEDGAGESSAHA